MSTSPTVPDVDTTDDVQEQDTATSFGEKNEKLPRCLVLAISDAFVSLQAREAYDRRIEVLTDRMHRFYDDGIQHVYPNYGTGAYQIGTAGGTVNIGNDSFQCPDYIGAYNIFYPIGRSLDAVLTQNPPGIDFRPDDPSRPEDMEAAETAEGYRHYFDQANDLKAIQQQISRMFRLSGRTVLETETISDEQAWGLNDQGEPRQMETAKVFGTLESKTAILAKCQKECSYVFLYSDPDALMAKEEFPQIADKIAGGQGGLGENEWERYARVGVQQARKGYFLTGNSGMHITTKIKGYMRPAVFGKYKDLYEPSPDEDPGFKADGETTVADKLKELFPDGLCATYVGQNFACAENRAMDDHIAIGFPKDRDGMSGGALMRDMVVIQDVVNDYKNATRSYYEKGWPSLWIDAEDAEFDAICDQKAEPAAIRQLKKKLPGGAAADSFYREPDMQLPESFVQEVSNMAGPFAQMVSGALPALQGDSKASSTASGQAMDRSQAMGMLGMPWANMQRLFARMYYQAALLAAKNPDHSKEIVVPGNSSTNQTLRLENLTKGKFMAHPDTDSSFPESTSAKRANLQSVMTMMGSNPTLSQTFLASPDNWEQILELMGFPELELTPADAYKKQVREFELLLRESPIPPDPQVVQQAMVQHAAATLSAQQTGAPPTPMPDPMSLMKSSQPPQELDYHNWEFAKCQEWLSSEACWRQQAEGNTDGIMNIRLHANEHKQFMAQQAAQAAAAQQQMKPPAESIAFKDESPAGQDAMNKQAGIITPPTAPEANTQVNKKSSPPGAPGKPTI